MKKLIILVALVMATTSLTACDLNVNKGGDSVSKVESAVEVNSATDKEISLASESDANSSVVEASSATGDESESKKDESKGEETDNPLFTWELKINGVDYNVPSSFAEFEKNGWELDGDDEEVGANTYLIGGKIKNGDSSISVDFWNPTDKAVKCSESQIGQMAIYADEGVDLELPGGLKFNSNTTAEEVKKLYGEPSYEKVSENYVVYEYEFDICSSVEFMIFTEDSGMLDYSHVKIENLV